MINLKKKNYDEKILKKIFKKYNTLKINFKY